ncbi:MAG: hypothetical protein V4722_13185 [Bacteroidota bacterium]
MPASSHKKNTGLTISKSNKAPLTKNQEAFNKLTTRIEKLHKEIEKKETQFETALKIYSTAIHPLRQQILKHRRVMIDLLWPLYQNRQLAKADQRHLKAILQDLVESVLQATSEPDESLKQIFGELEGESYDSIKTREENMIKEEVQEMFDDLDIDIDLEDLDVNDKSFAEKLAAAQERMREKMEREQQRKEYQQQHRQRVTRKTARELELEKMQQAAEEMKHKNISTIYRQLAKLFHPDLEQDEGRRVEKGELMKQLTAAYESKNLHALLSLELKWIHKENDHLALLTEEKLAVYLQILREQAQQLESQKQQIFRKPQYGVLLEDFGYPVAAQPLLFINREKQNLELEVNSLKTDLAHFQSVNGMKYIRQMIKEWNHHDHDAVDVDALFDSILRSNGRTSR